MDKVTIIDYDRIYKNFIDEKYLHGHDEYYYRDQQVKKPAGGWRHLHSDEIERLVKTATLPPIGTTSGSPTSSTPA